MTDAVVERFERHLAEETSKLRVDMAQGFASVRAETAAGIANLRVDLLKWAFVFWVGQFFAVATLVGVVLRYVRPA